MAVYKYLCEFGHRGMIERPIARCEQCDAPVQLSSDYRGIGVDEAEWARLAAICEKVPGLDDVFATVLQALHNYAAVEGISFDDLSPSTIVSRNGVIVLEIIAPPTPEEDAA